MHSGKDDIQNHRTPGSWGRFAVCVFGFAAVLFFFTRGVTPPGVFGEVVRHNRAGAIDATPYFYTEVENIVELQAGIEQWWSKTDTMNSITTWMTDSSRVPQNDK